MKQFSDGCEKPGVKGVTAKRVLNMEPFFEYLPNRMVLTTFDHDVKENLHPAAKQALEKENSLNTLLIMKKYGYDTNKSAAIYSKTTDHPLVSVQQLSPQGETQVVLGRSEYQYKREYDYFINTESQLRHNVILYLKDSKVRYLKPSAIFIMSKKKSSTETGSALSQRLLIDARSFSKEEVARSNHKYETIGCHIRVDEALLNKCIVEVKQPVKAAVKAAPEPEPVAPSEEKKADEENSKEGGVADVLGDLNPEPEKEVAVPEKQGVATEKAIPTEAVNPARKEAYKEEGVISEKQAVSETHKKVEDDDAFFESAFK